MRFYVSDYKAVHAFDIESPLDFPVAAWCQKVSKPPASRKRRPIVSTVYIPANPSRGKGCTEELRQVVREVTQEVKREMEGVPGDKNGAVGIAGEVVLGEEKEKLDVKGNDVVPKIMVNDETHSIAPSDVESARRAGSEANSPITHFKGGIVAIGANGAISGFNAETGQFLYRVPFKRFAGMPVSLLHVPATDTLVAGVHNYVFVLCPHVGKILDRLKISSKEHVNVPNCILVKGGRDGVVAVHSSVSRRVVFLDTAKAVDIKPANRVPKSLKLGLQDDDESSSSSDEDEGTKPIIGRCKVGEIRVGRKLGKRRKQLSAMIGMRLHGRMPAIGAVHICPDNTVAISRKDQYRAFAPVEGKACKAKAKLGRKGGHPVNVPHPALPHRHRPNLTSSDEETGDQGNSMIKAQDLPMKAAAKVLETRRVTVDGSGKRTTPTNFLVDEAGDRLYVAGMFVVSCFELSSSKRLWHLDLRQYAGRLNHVCQTMIKVSQSTTSSLLIMTFGKRVIAVETRDGKLMWQHVMPKRVLGLKDGLRANVIHGNATAATVLVFDTEKKKTLRGKRTKRSQRRHRHHHHPRRHSHQKSEGGNESQSGSQVESEGKTDTGAVSELVNEQSDTAKSQPTGTSATDAASPTSPPPIGKFTNTEVLASPESIGNRPSSSDSGYSEPPRPISSKLLLIGSNSIFQGLNVQHGTLLFTIKLTTTAASFISFAAPHCDSKCVSEFGVRGPCMEENLRGEYGKKKKRNEAIQKVLRGMGHENKVEVEEEEDGEADELGEGVEGAGVQVEVQASDVIAMPK